MTEQDARTVPAPPPVQSWWERHRKWFVDGGIVGVCALAAHHGWVEWDTVVPAVVAVVLAHAPPQATSLETAATPLVTALGRLLRRR